MLHRPTAAELNRATAAGIRYLEGVQLPRGGFLSYSTTDPEDFERAFAYRTTFFPSLILSALSQCEIDGSQVVRRRLVDFLLAQHSEAWSFNYWDRTSPESRAQPYPDDLDDTMAALAALWSADPALFDGKLNAHLAKLLIATEVEPGGPYRTWLVDEQADQQWQDVDLAVNANIARCLSLQGVKLPNLERLIDSAISKDEIRSPYYPNAYPLIYFTSQWYQGTHRDELQRRLLDWQQQGYWHNPLQTALAISSLCRLGGAAKTLQPASMYLLSTQASDGSWPASAFCIDPMQRGQTAYAGSPALTTALCIEALQLYQQRPPDQQLAQPMADPRYTTVTRQVRDRLQQLEASELKRLSLKTLRRLLQQDTDRQIVLLPWLIADALQREVDESVLRQLAAASLWGWMAYTLYDDFLDDEGDAAYLPVANVCLRQLVLTLQASLEQADFQQWCRAILDRQEAANAWEVTYCRAKVRKGTLYVGHLPDYGDYSQLADRSFGHAIAAFGVLAAAGLTKNSPAAGYLQDFFRHYLIARQLDDDAHDWEEDLRAGRLNAVTTLVLAAYQGRHGLKKAIDLQAASDELRLLMWEEVMPVVCKDITRHVQAARRALKQTRFPQTRKLAGLLARHERSAQQAMQRRTETMEFIATLQES